MKIEIPSHLSDHDLVAQVKSLAQCEREATASFVSHLGELDSRHLYLAAGFSSLFGYCCEVLHLSEPAAYNRIEVARTARTFPVILSMLAEGIELGDGAAARGQTDRREPSGPACGGRGQEQAPSRGDAGPLLPNGPPGRRTLPGKSASPFSSSVNAK